MPLDGAFFIGMTVHTATMNGAIYEKATSDVDGFNKIRKSSAVDCCSATF